MMFGQDQKATVVGDQVQPIVVMANTTGWPDLRQRAFSDAATGYRMTSRRLKLGALGWWRLRRFIPALPGVVQRRGQPHGKIVNLG